MSFSIKIQYIFLISLFFGAYHIYALSLLPNSNFRCISNFFRNKSGFVSSSNNSVCRQNKSNPLFSKLDSSNCFEGKCQVKNYETLKEFENEVDRAFPQDLGLVGVSGFVYHTDDKPDSKKIYIRDGTTMYPLGISIKDEQKMVPNKDTIGPGTRVIATGSSMCNQNEDGSREYYVSIDTNIEGHKLEHFTVDDEDYKKSLAYHHNDYNIEHKRFPEHSYLSHKFKVLKDIMFKTRQFIENYFAEKNFFMVEFNPFGDFYLEKVLKSKMEAKRSLDTKDAPKKKEEKALSDFPPLILEMSSPLDVESFAFPYSYKTECLVDKNNLKTFPIILTNFPITTIEDLIDSIEDLIRDSARYVLDDCTELLEQASKYNDKLKDHLSHLSNIRIRTMTYDDAINMLNEMRKSEPEKYKYQYIDWGGRLSDSHEKSLMDHYDNKEIIAITNYPESITPFYMKRSIESFGDDSKTTVENFDIIAPFGYEIAGGSLREENYYLLKRKMLERGIYGKDFDKYLRMRKDTDSLQGGYAVGFDRLIMLLLMNDDIRYLAPFSSR